MTLLSFIIIVIISILIAIAWEAFKNIIPSLLQAKREEAFSSLTKCITQLNKKVLIEGKIKGGQHLHDITYKSLLLILCERPRLDYTMTKDIQYTEENEKDRINFRRELDSLDEETKLIMENAFIATSKVLFFSNPMISIRIVGKVIQATIDYHKTKEDFKKKMLHSTEYYILKKNKELVGC